MKKLVGPTSVKTASIAFGLLVTIIITKKYELAGFGQYSEFTKTYLLISALGLMGYPDYIAVNAPSKVNLLEFVIRALITTLLVILFLAITNRIDVRIIFATFINTLNILISSYYYNKKQYYFAIILENSIVQIFVFMGILIIPRINPISIHFMSLLLVFIIGIISIYNNLEIKATKISFSYLRSFGINNASETVRISSITLLPSFFLSDARFGEFSLLYRISHIGGFLNMLLKKYGLSGFQYKKFQTNWVSRVSSLILIQIVGITLLPFLINLLYGFTLNIESQITLSILFNCWIIGVVSEHRRSTKVKNEDYKYTLWSGILSVTFALTLSLVLSFWTSIFMASVMYLIYMLIEYVIRAKKR